MANPETTRQLAARLRPFFGFNSNDYVLSNQYHLTSKVMVDFPYVTEYMYFYFRALPGFLCFYFYDQVVQIAPFATSLIFNVDVVGLLEVGIYTFPCYTYLPAGARVNGRCRITVNSVNNQRNLSNISIQLFGEMAQGYMTEGTYTINACSIVLPTLNRNPTVVSSPIIGSTTLAPVVFSVEPDIDEFGTIVEIVNI